LDFREFTTSALSFWGSSCAENLLGGVGYSTYLRHRNNWINVNLPLGLSGLMMYDCGKMAGFTLEMPIEHAPVPILGKNIGVFICYWTRPEISVPNRKSVMLEKALVRLAGKGYEGVAVICSCWHDEPIWEALGFSQIDTVKILGLNSTVLFKSFINGTKPIIQKPTSLSPPKNKHIAIDIFYQSFCPISTILISRLMKQTPDFLKILEVRMHETSTRNEVMRFGHMKDVYMNGDNITKEILLEKPLSNVIARYQ